MENCCERHWYYFFYLHVVIHHSHTTTPMMRRMCVRCATGYYGSWCRIVCVVRWRYIAIGNRSWFNEEIAHVLRYVVWMRCECKSALSAATECERWRGNVYTLIPFGCRLLLLLFCCCFFVYSFFVVFFCSRLRSTRLCRRVSINFWV